MSVKIRLKKLGRRHRPFFRVCAMDTRTRRDGREIEVLGTYDPMVPETDARAILNGERIDYWLGVGATPSPKVGTLIKKYGTNGTHLEAQQAAFDKLGGRRAASISAAVSEAEKTKLEKASEEAASAESEATASADEASAENASEAAASEAATGEAATGEAATSEATTTEESATTEETASAEESAEKPADEAPADEKSEESKTDE